MVGMGMKVVKAQLESTRKVMMDGSMNIARHVLGTRDKGEVVMNHGRMCILLLE